MKKKKGFTLIELMIVLAIIAILAIVLVPKVAQMKDNSRNAGVTTNVNAVRGILEAKVVDITYLGKVDPTKTLLINAFKTTPLVNPFNANGNIVDDNTNYDLIPSTDVSTKNDSIVVHSAVNSLAENFATPTGIAANKGIVYVYVYKDGYVVFGIDSTGTAVNIATIK